MDRIIFMVLRNIYRAPFWFYRVVKMGREDAACTEQERYGYIRRMVEDRIASILVERGEGAIAGVAVTAKDGELVLETM